MVCVCVCVCFHYTCLCVGGVVGGIELYGVGCSGYCWFKRCQVCIGFAETISAKS